MLPHRCSHTAGVSHILPFAVLLDTDDSETYHVLHSLACSSLGSTPAQTTSRCSLLLADEVLLSETTLQRTFVCLSPYTHAGGLLQGCSHQTASELAYQRALPSEAQDSLRDNTFTLCQGQRKVLGTFPTPSGRCSQEANTCGHAAQMLGVDWLQTRAPDHGPAPTSLPTLGCYQDNFMSPPPPRSPPITSHSLKNFV